MNSFGNALLLAMPVFYALILIEVIWTVYVKGDRFNIIDGISSISSGFTHILKSTLGLTVVVFSYPWFREHLSIIQWNETGIAPYLITFIVLDFIAYWLHRLSHRVNFFWNHHVIHHSSEEFNLPCALRQNITIITNILSIAFVPLAVMGIDYSVILLVGPLHFFAQFWYHTKYIGKLGFLEHIIVTPSHHRVHHAMNDLYMDKNYSAIFIVWDKWFGTFQEELDTEPCVYGMRRPAQSWNPFIINFKHYWTLIKDAWQTKKLKDKFRIWFMPTGWRPEDVAKTNPLLTIEKVENFKKYNPTYSKTFIAFSFLHANVLFLLILFLFSRLGELSQSEALTYGILLLLSVFSFTSILDKKQIGLISTIAASLLIIIFCYLKGDWFGLNSFLPNGSSFVSAYYLVSGFLFALLYVKELRIPDNQLNFSEVNFESHSETFS